MSNNKQKLELTWIGKNNPEYDIANIEPRILEERTDLSYGDKNTENMIIHGDNLLALKALLPEYEGKVKCIYIDPPYNTGNAFEHYDDSVEHSTWLSLMKPRLELLRMLLSDDGVIFIQIDNSEQAYLKVLLDEVFQRNNFITSFILKVRHSERMLKGDKDIHDVAEYVHCYQKTNQFEISKRKQVVADDPYEDYQWEVKTIGTGKILVLGNKECRVFKPGEYELIRLGGNKSGFKKINIRGGLREGNSSGRFYVAHIEKRLQSDGYNVLYEVPNIGDDGTGRRYFLLPENMKKKNGNYFQGVPQTRTSSKDLPYPSFFDVSAAFNRVGYEGVVEFRNSKKPESLVKTFFEIANLSSKDLVLDSFLGSGTTAAVAHKMNFNYIGIEMGNHAYSHVHKRMKAVIDAEDPSGISEAVNWHGGGGFKFYDLAPSFLVIDEFGNPVIDNYYNDVKLIRAMCKLTNYSFAPSATEYWKHGKGQGNNSIYVTTQMLSVAMVQQIVSHLDTNETLLICPKKFEPGCESIDARITIKKIPQSILKACQFGKKEYLLPIKERVMEEVDEDEVDSEEN